jgi:hypothetical protein
MPSFIRRFRFPWWLQYVSVPVLSALFAGITNCFPDLQMLGVLPLSMADTLKYTYFYNCLGFYFFAGSLLQLVCCLRPEHANTFGDGDQSSDVEVIPSTKLNYITVIRQLIVSTFVLLWLGAYLYTLVPAFRADRNYPESVGTSLDAIENRVASGMSAYRISHEPEPPRLRGLSWKFRDELRDLKPLLEKPLANGVHHGSDDDVRIAALLGAIAWEQRDRRRFAKSADACLDLYRYGSILSIGGNLTDRDITSATHHWAMVGLSRIQQSLPAKERARILMEMRKFHDAIEPWELAAWRLRRDTYESRSLPPKWLGALANDALLYSGEQSRWGDANSKEYMETIEREYRDFERQFAVDTGPTATKR